MDYGSGSSNILIVILNLAIITTLIIMMLSKKLGLNKYACGSILLIIAGGMGNILDRIFRGYVIDYIDINKLISYPLFNFADICIVVGVVILGISLLIDIVCEKQENNKDEKI